MNIWRETEERSGRRGLQRNPYAIRRVGKTRTIRKGKKMKEKERKGKKRKKKKEKKKKNKEGESFKATLTRKRKH